MGLDMYLTGHKWKPEPTETEDGFPVETKILTLGYWRKHPDLHGFIVQAFADGDDKCQQIELDAVSIRNVISAITEKRLPKTTGFFFGESVNDAKQRKRDIEIFEKALAWLEGVPKPPQPKMVGEGGGMRMYRIEAANVPVELRTIVYRASW